MVEQVDSPTSTAQPTGTRRPAQLRFPEVDGRRSTTATGRSILADAARAADPELATRIEACDSWRRGYAPLLRELTARAAEPDRAHAIARAGLASMLGRLVLDDASGTTLAGALSAQQPASAPGTGAVHGSAAPVTRLDVPYRGRTLHGPELTAKLERWADDGIVEPSFARAIAEVVEHPEWLHLPGRTVVLIGAGSEIGPLAPLCAWGADVLAIDLPEERVWRRVREIAERGSGTVRMPLAADGTTGIDVVADLPAAHGWVAANLNGGEPVLGMHAYADGGAHVLITAAFDALSTALADRRPALAYLATPTDAYVVPSATAERARAAYDARRARRLAQAPLKLISGGRLYRPAYAEAVPVADALIEQQGPNYAIAKRLQRWRGLAAAAAGQRVSFNVAPATWTRSVTKNRVLAAAYAGARHFGIEIFEPATTRTLMAALLVHDLNTEPSGGREAEELFSDAAAHGGLWTAAYEPRSALGLAALAGLPAAMLSRRRVGAAS